MNAFLALFWKIIKAYTLKKLSIFMDLTIKKTLYGKGFKVHFVMDFTGHECLAVEFRGINEIFLTTFQLSEEELLRYIGKVAYKLPFRAPEVIPGFLEEMGFARAVKGTVLKEP